jgi:hypothetical protein
MKLLQELLLESSTPPWAASQIKTYNLDNKTGRNLNLACYNERLQRISKMPSTTPKVVDGDVDLGGNAISSFDNFPHTISGILEISDNVFKSFKDIHLHINQVSGADGIFALHNPIKSHLLGLLKIKKLKLVTLVTAGQARSTIKQYQDLGKAEKIINKYLPEGDLFDCQEELIEAGLEEFAQL